MNVDDMVKTKDIIVELAEWEATRSLEKGYKILELMCELFFWDIKHEQIDQIMKMEKIWKTK